jgi:hypothetical protein
VLGSEIAKHRKSIQDWQRNIKKDYIQIFRAPTGQGLFTIECQLNKVSFTSKCTLK